MPIENQCKDCKSYSEDANYCNKGQSNLVYDGTACEYFYHKKLDEIEQSGAYSMNKDVYSVNSVQRMADRTISGWLVWLLIAISTGALLTLVISFTQSIEDYYYPEVSNNVAFWGFIIDKIVDVGIFLLALYTVISFYKFKPNAVALGKSYVIIIFITNIIGLIFGEFESYGIGSLPQLVRSTIWGAIWFTFLCVSKQVNRLYPKSERRFFKRDKWILSIFVGSIVFCFVALFFSAFVEEINMNSELLINEEWFIR